ncbi:MAG: maltose alpha-D-glucosyltransferase [Phycisphaerae bacterium]|nr:maltose alpha-D-glucosyltransferase [Phycisphaerae bacterium]
MGSKASSKSGSQATSRPTGSPKSARPPKSRRAASSYAGPTPPDWYKDAIIYELHVRAFQDSDGDGMGDFRGLTSRLDYLRDLGVTAIWLLPFYPSPLRDDGYDIADYTSVNPDYGTMADFRKFVAEAHARDIRVITELVINHTSDQHPWFQRARRAAKGSKHRDFYVWSDTPDKYPGVRIIFQDTETSNWTWDPVAKQYYWHRFFSHQPDLNFENPEVIKAVKSFMDFWFEAGVDGMRLDAVPYLVERDGTNCENLDETHVILKDLRAHLDENWPGRMFLAEANQWPEDAIAYYGDGDECHMNFHFPLMPRLFMGLRMEDSYPIIDILSQTPEIPESCQWALFLRNHDELTLEMVTDEERDYMYRRYASDPQMRINVGIRRRLAPLLEHNRRKIELLNGLLMSLPGTPVLYYGDEIGMGDNIYLGDRDAVRTPMQWSADRNAGFSRANPQKLLLPVNIEPGSHFETVNVETQLTNTSSLLRWMRQLIALRKRHPVLARGSMELLQPANGKVLVFLRSGEGEDILVVANLSRFAQPVELDLSRFKGRTPVEVFGYTRFPPIGELPYFLTLSPHSFYWFVLEPEPTADASDSDEAPIIEASGDPATWLRGAGVKRWAGRQLQDVLRSRRWFAGKARTIRETWIEDMISLGKLDEGVVDAAILLVGVAYAEGDDETYTLPLALLDAERAAMRGGVSSGAVFGALRQKGDGPKLILVDATIDESFWRRVHDTLVKRKTLKGDGGTLTGIRVAGGAKAPASEADEIRVPRVEQSNSSAIFSRSSIMKLFRRVEVGLNPDFEIGARLTDQKSFRNTPSLHGALEYRVGRDAVITLATKQELIASEGDAWGHATDAVGRYFERVLWMTDEDRTRFEPSAQPLDLIDHPLDDDHAEALDGYSHTVELLGRRTAEMHAALADSTDAAFEPEPFSKLYLRSLYQTLRNGVRRPLQTLRTSSGKLEGDARDLAEEVLERKDELLARISRVRDLPLDGVRIRCHGDYHLGQVLWTGEDFFIIDFEGEPMRTLGERRLKRSPLSDVAGMCRSLDYAAFAGLNALVERGMVESRDEQMSRLADFWSVNARAAFLRGYLNAAEAPLVPADRGAIELLLDAWTLHKAAYEVDYELNNRPDWVSIPLRGILGVLDEAPAEVGG